MGGPSAPPSPLDTHDIIKTEANSSATRRSGSVCGCDILKIFNCGGSCVTAHPAVNRGVLFCIYERRSHLLSASVCIYRTKSPLL